MNMYVWKRMLQCCLVALFILAMTSLAEAAGPMSLKVTNAEAGDMSGSKQAIIFWMDVKNTTSHEYISRLNHVEVEVTGSWGNGRQEKYRRKVNVDWTFEPALGPGNVKKLRVRFMRSVNPDKGWFKYRNVQVRVLTYNFKRTS